MKKFFVIALALALTAGAAYANYCARDYVPAATLLVPYAVVDMDATGVTPDPQGYTTLLTVTNTSSWREIIHVTVWSPLSNAVVDFDEVLSGYDVWTINFRDLLTGRFDLFDTEGNDGMWYSPTSSSVYGATKLGSTTNRGKTMPPWGPTTNGGYNTSLREAEDTDYPSNVSSSCAMPYGNHPEYGQGIVGALRFDTFAIPYQWEVCRTNSLFGSPPWLAGLTADPLFFYVTIDVVKNCNLLFPDDDPYWNTSVAYRPEIMGGLAYRGYPAPDNVLIGEVAYLNNTLNRSEVMPAVHIEFDWDAVGDGPTFYCVAFDNDACDYDGREPLATAFAFRYYNDNTQGIHSELLLWKSHHEFSYYLYFEYGIYATYACGPYIYFAWDDHEDTKSRGVGPSGFDVPEPDVIPFETQAVPMTVANWRGIFDRNGWMLLIFDPSIEDWGEGWDTEAWAGVRHTFQGYSAGLEAATMANYWCYGQRLPDLSWGWDYDDNWWSF